MDKPTGNQGRHQHRPPARAPSSNKNIPSNKPRHQVQSPLPTSPSKVGASQALKKSGPSRIYVESSRGPMPDFDAPAGADFVRMVHLSQSALLSVPRAIPRPHGNQQFPALLAPPVILTAPISCF